MMDSSESPQSGGSGPTIRVSADEHSFFPSNEIPRANCGFQGGLFPFSSAELNVGSPNIFAQGGLTLSQAT